MTDDIDLGVALDAIVERLSQQFPAYRTVAAEDESRTELAVPAIVVQISELEPAPEKEPFTGQFPCLCHVEARIILGHRTPKVRREVLKAAGALASFVHQNRLGIRWGEAQVLAIEPDDFAPSADQFDIWRIEWVHQVDLGENFLIDEGVTPAQLLTSWAPIIGPENEANYIPEGQ